MFVRKLQGHGPIAPADATLIHELCAAPRTVAAHTDLAHEGDRPSAVFIMLEGWACRYKLLPDGSRQITAFLLPGDFCDVPVAIVNEMDHSIGTLTKATIVAVPPLLMQSLVEARPGIARAVRWSQFVDEAILRAWLVNLGRRDATQRVAHLLSELWQRASDIGLISGGLLHLPITQTDIADALGLTNIHVNRVLQDLRYEQLIRFGPRRTFSVPNPPALAAMGGFQPTYLHRRRRVRQPGESRTGPGAGAAFHG